tara:strand:+ start:13790 stop:14554 length:765 start_codon:yes stop_codon:yes gene_type:complete
VQYKKKLGQNFLVDKNIIEKIIKHFNPKKSDYILEIGPGDGALTKHICDLAKNLIIIEKDADLIDELSMMIANHKKVKLHNTDVLRFNFSSIKSKIRVVGNLPYNISTEIIFKLCNIDNVLDMHFMLQKEVVDRMVSKPNNKIYGRLSIMAQTYFNIEKLFDVSENVFKPRPKVKSSFIRLIPKAKIFDDRKHEICFSNIVRSSFEERRKMIRSSLNKYLSEEDFINIGIDSKLRAENLTVNNYLSISRHVKEI